jgi:hypothetical protein
VEKYNIIHMDNDVSVLISQETINSLQKGLVDQGINLIDYVKNNHHISTKQLLQNCRKKKQKKFNFDSFIKKYNHNERLIKDHCLARTWNEGYGGQCNRSHNQGSNFCKLHKKQFDSEKGLPHGIIGHGCPKKLTYNNLIEVVKKRNGLEDGEGERFA